jgi:hypothetical protein
MSHISLAHEARDLRQRQLLRRRLRWSVLMEAAVALAALPALAIPGMPGDRWVAMVGVVICVVGAAIKWRVVDPDDVGSVTIAGWSSMAMATGAMLLESYFGLGSAVAALIVVGVLAHAMDDASRWPARVAVFVTVSHLALATLCELTNLPIHRVDWQGHASSVPVRIVMHLGIASSYLMAHVYGRRLRLESTLAQAGLDEAAHAVALGEALLAEARTELEAARSAGRGRFTGVRMGHFVLGTLLGRGGMGEVYEARDTEGTRAAVKVLRFGRGSLEGRTLARFEQESRILSSIASPFLVKVLEVSGEDDEFPFIAMELLSGLDLERYLVRYGELAPEEVLVMVHDVAHALDAAHRHGVVHRDLKPANIFRTLVDGEASWRVLDFGIALLRQSDARITTQQQLGTVGYMAPEQRIEGADVDARADVYALAVVTLECLTLFNPVVTNLDRTLGSWSPDAIARADEALSELPASVASVLRRALSDDPMARHRDCIRFAAALAAAHAAGESHVGQTEAGEFEALPTVAGPRRRSDPNVLRVEALGG